MSLPPQKQVHNSVQRSTADRRTPHALSSVFPLPPSPLCLVPPGPPSRSRGSPKAIPSAVPPTTAAASPCFDLDVLLTGSSVVVPVVVMSSSLLPHFHCQLISQRSEQIWLWFGKKFCKQLPHLRRCQWTFLRSDLIAALVQPPCVCQL
mmetsp:Transcript_8522/g.14630  ORF Transcript_8522/g.14630 Transcript_8522/m.14630 type:complete len:149 (-) Transcript_8522:477-923(-)